MSYFGLEVLQKLNQSAGSKLNMSLNSSKLSSFHYRATDEGTTSPNSTANWSKLLSNSSSSFNWSESFSDSSSPRLRRGNRQTAGPNSLELTPATSAHSAIYTESQFRRLMFKDRAETSALDESSFARKIDFVFANSNASFTEHGTQGYQVGYTKVVGVDLNGRFPT